MYLYVLIEKTESIFLMYKMSMSASNRSSLSLNDYNYVYLDLSQAALEGHLSHVTCFRAYQWLRGKMFVSVFLSMGPAECNPPTPPPEYISYGVENLIILWGLSAGPAA